MPPIVLLIDDNPSDIDLIRLAFREAGIEAEFETARDGVDAVVVIQRMADALRWPNLIVLDLNMPRASGFAVLSFLRNQSPWSRTPRVVVFTSSTQEADRARSLIAGADDFCPKPSTFESLVVLVRQVYQRHVVGRTLESRT